MLSRRQSLGLFATAPMLAAGSLKAAVSKTIIVIGAGMAGLAAARALKGAGHRVIVLEAQQRIGGRIWTSHVWPDLPVDLGASWIHHVKGNPITALAEQSGARRFETSYQRSRAYDAEGHERDYDALYGPAIALVKAARKQAEKRESDVSLADAVERSAAWQQADAELRRLVRQYINDSVEQEYGGDWRAVSSWFYDDISEYGGGDVLFPEGYEQVPRFLAHGLDVRLGQRVTELAPEAKGASVRLADGQSLSADHVVITAALGALQKGVIAFAAPLQGERLAAIKALRMGVLNKCWLRFERIAWPRDADWLTWMGPRDGLWAQWVSLARLNQPVLLAFHAGAQAQALEAQSDAAMMAQAHEALRAMFGASFPAPVAAQVTRWHADPLSFGSYSFNSVGVTGATRKALGGTDWDGRLIFAGEATAPRAFGTVHGAYLSGLEAAKSL